MKRQIALAAIALAAGGSAAAQSNEELKTMLDQALKTIQDLQGRVKALAVSTIRRSSVAPDIPPLADTVPGFDVSSFYGIVVPARTPPAVIAKLNAEIGKVMQMPEVKAKLLESGVEARTSTPEQLGAMVQSETAKWGKIIADAGIKAE